MKLFGSIRDKETKTISKPRRLPSLVICIIMDLIGLLSYGVPFFGELLDLVWAPISGIIFFLMFGGWKGAFGGIFNFVEELLPGTDFIPSFTIMWLVQYFRNRSSSSSFNTYPSSEI
jgi:hypothetical protein